ncbi:MAG: T9SS type A sorting domain-containing protein [Ignavibacteriales bacterium]|nr:T9SS type A sorting domain-containing protein [Ignavibacteriales bacterium]
MTKMIRWIYRPRVDGGDSKEKNANDPNFTKASPGHWTYDYNRKTVEYYFDTLNCKITGTAAVLATLVSSDGKVVGDQRWGTPKTGVISNQQMPGVFALDQNYPNPFNPATTIGFAIPKSGMVTLTVFNMLGQEVATILRGEMNAGRHDVSFDASALSSGMYMYRLNAGGSTAVQKMMLLK